MNAQRNLFFEHSLRMNANLLVMKKGNIPFFSERKTTRENFKLSLRETYILAMGLIGVLGIYYVFVLNANATKGYSIRTLEIARKQYNFEENLLGIKIAEAEALSTVTNSSLVRTMEDIDSPRYIILQDSLYTYKK
jgi:hypothetical protein